MDSIQIKNINRSETQPIFIKEKILENGETIRIIYQRKNIESIDGLFERIKTRVRYTTQDFAQKFDLTSLKKALGFTSLRILVDKDESKETARDFKSKMSTEGDDGESKNELKELFDSKFVSYDENTKFEINLEKYELNEFLRDLSSIGKTPKNVATWKDHESVFYLFHRSATSNLMTRKEIKEISNGFEEMKGAIKDYLKDKRADDDIKKRFMDKLDEVRNQSINSKPTDKEMKIWCLTYEEGRYNSYGQGYKGVPPKTDPSVLNSIDKLFSSTSTQKEKEAAQKELQNHYKDARSTLPLYIEEKIFPAQQGFYESCFFPTTIIDPGPERMVSGSSNYGSSHNGS